mgnify:CR=1 FL=1
MNLLEDIFNGLYFNTVPANLELHVDSAEEMYALSLNVDFAFISGAKEAAKLRVRNELLSG